MDVREKSGNFISSCDKKENDSFWEQLLVLKMYLLITSCLSFQKKKIISKKTFFQDCLLIDPAFNSWLEKVNELTIFQCKFCKSQNSLFRMGKRAIVSHMEGQKH